MRASSLAALAGICVLASPLSSGAAARKVAALRADFTALPTAGPTPLRVEFRDLSTGGPTSWRWDFGDGSSGSGRTRATPIAVREAAPCR